MQTDVSLVTYTVLLPTNPCCSITESRAFLSLASFWWIQKGLTMNQVRSLLSMPSMLLLNPNLVAMRLLQWAQLWLLVINKQMLVPEKKSLMRENKIIWL